MLVTSSIIPYLKIMWGLPPRLGLRPPPSKSGAGCAPGCTAMYLPKDLVVFFFDLGVARGAWSPNYINSIMCPPFCQSYKKVVLRLSEHGDAIETQTTKFVPSKFFSKLGPWVSV